MKKIRYTFLALFVLSACSSAQVQNTEEPEPEVPQERAMTVEIPLYSIAQWSEPREAVRTFAYLEQEVTVEGREIEGVYSDETVELYYRESEFADEDFWHYYMGEQKLLDLGYKGSFISEVDIDRNLIGAISEDGYTLLISHITDFSGDNPNDFECPCTFTFMIFTDDPRILLE